MSVKSTSQASTSLSGGCGIPVADATKTGAAVATGLCLSFDEDSFGSPPSPEPDDVCRSSDDSSGLFSCGFTVERITIILFSRSNQNGAPIEQASAVTNQPRMWCRTSLPVLMFVQPTGSSDSSVIF